MEQFSKPKYRPKIRFRNWVNRNYDIDGEKLLDENFLQMQKIGIEFVKKRKYRRRKTNTRKFTGFNSVEDSPTEMGAPSRQLTFDLVEETGRRRRVSGKEINCDEDSLPSIPKVIPNLSKFNNISDLGSFLNEKEEETQKVLPEPKKSEHVSGININLKEMESHIRDPVFEENGHVPSAIFPKDVSKILPEGEGQKDFLDPDPMTLPFPKEESKTDSLDLDTKLKNAEFENLKDLDESEMKQPKLQLIDVEGFVDSKQLEQRRLKQKNKKFVVSGEVMEVSEENSPKGKKKKPKKPKKPKKKKNKNQGLANDGVFVESEENSVDNEFQISKLSEHMKGENDHETEFMPLETRTNNSQPQSASKLVKNTAHRTSQPKTEKPNPDPQTTNDQNPSTFDSRSTPEVKPVSTPQQLKKCSPSQRTPENNISLKERSQLQISKSCLSIPSESKSRLPAAPSQTPMNTTLLSNAHFRNLSPKTASNRVNLHEVSVNAHSNPYHPNNKGVEALSASPQKRSNQKGRASGKTAKSLMLAKHELEAREREKRVKSEDSRENLSDQSIDNISNKANLNSKFDQGEASLPKDEMDEAIDSTKLALKMTKKASKESPSKSKKHSSKNSPKKVRSRPLTEKEKPEQSFSEKPLTPHTFPSIGYRVPMNLNGSLPGTKTRRQGKMIPLNEDDDDEEDDDLTTFNKQPMNVHGVLSRSLIPPFRGSLSPALRAAHNIKARMSNLGLSKMGLPMRNMRMAQLGMGYGSYLNSGTQQRLMAQRMQLSRAFKEGAIPDLKGLLKKTKKSTGAHPYFLQKRKGAYPMRFNTRRV